MLFAALPLVSAVSLLASPDDFPAELCSKWNDALAAAKAATDGGREAPSKSFYDVTVAAWGSVKPPPEWGRAWKNLGAVGDTGKLELLRDEAKSHGGHFDCPGFEFPFGAPSGDVLLPVGENVQIAALAADDSGLWWLACHREKRGNDQCDLMHFDSGPKVVAAGLPPARVDTPLVLDAKEIFTALGNQLVAVAKTGGAARVVAKVPGICRSIAFDGDDLVFTDDEYVQRVPRAGGEPKQVFQEKSTRENGGTLELLFPTAQGLFLTEWEHGLYRLDQGAASRVLPDQAPYSPAVLDGSLWFIGTQEKKHMLFRFDPATSKATAVIEAGAAHALRASRGELFAVSSTNSWPGSYQVLRYKLKAKAFEVVARRQGDVELTAADAKRVYWYDRRSRRLMSAPRTP